MFGLLFVVLLVLVLGVLVVVVRFVGYLLTVGWLLCGLLCFGCEVACFGL